MSTTSLRIVFAGTPQFAVPSLTALVESPHTLAAVFTQPDRPAGRGRRLQPPPVKTAAEQAGIPVHQPECLDVDALAAASGADRDDALRPDLLVVVAFGQLLGAEVLGYARHGALNVHASLLPRWRGAAPIARALLAGDAETGVTVMQMVPALDAGPVLARRACAIAVDDTAATLHDRLAALGGEALLEVLTDLPGHLDRAEPQGAAGVTYAAKLSRAEGRLDWDAPATELARRVRALQPWPGAWTPLGEDPLRIWAAEAQAGPAAGAPGTVLATGRSGIDVATGDGVLRLTRIQPAGGKAMPAADFARARDLVGVRLGAT